MPSDGTTLMPSSLAHRVGVAPDPRTSALRRFVEEHAAALRSAAELLGGPRHCQTVEEILDAFARDPVPGRRTLRQLDDLLLLLSLEPISDADSDKPDLFGLIDPADPVVAKLCLLTDGLRQALGSYWSSRDEPARRALDSAA